MSAGVLCAAASMKTPAAVMMQISFRVRSVGAPTIADHFPDTRHRIVLWPMDIVCGGQSAATPSLCRFRRMPSDASDPASRTYANTVLADAAAIQVLPIWTAANCSGPLNG